MPIHDFIQWSRLPRVYRLWYNQPQMGTTSQRGFTIVETMLFLAIGGTLFAVLMVGVGTGITQQRYMESVRGYKSLLQDQYAQVLNTSIDGKAGWQCENDESGTVGEGPRGVRGTSDCVVLGRLIQVKDDGTGTTVVVSSVTGFDDPLAQTGLDDVEAIKNYKPKVGAFDKQEIELDWGVGLRTNGQPSKAAVLIVRSPVSGLIKVFTLEQGIVSQDLISMVSADNTLVAATVRMCIDGDSGLLPKQVVAINPQLASADAVATDTSANGECG